ncbi:MAG TPA: Na/Pi symporter [Kiritimatiellia bacterium]|nr:Na/Pi symporter [Kiritimatiellia bacterium]
MPNDYFHALTGFGGLALFLYGILLLSDGLKEASSDTLRKWISRINTNRRHGYLLGVTMGATLQSSATTVMAVGFLNAGLLSLAGAIPLIAGANLGTSFAMQFIALDIEWLWPVLALLGLPLRLWRGDIKRRRVGQALIGLSLLFLGLRLMSQSVFPYRELLSSWFVGHDGGSWIEFFLSMAIALAFTLIVQSSSATMAILFSLSTSGVFTDISQVFPLVIGAQVGTCITALISSIGTSPDARRGALAHLYFNIIAGSMAILLMPWLSQLIEAIGFSPARQVANVHTAIMLIGGLVIVPFSNVLVRLLHATIRFSNRLQEQSFLDIDLIETPEKALDASNRELTRITRIVRRGFILNRELLASPNRRTYLLVKNSEETIDLIYHAMRQYLKNVARHVADATQASRIQWMNLYLIFLERISDHNDNLADLTLDMSGNIPEKDIPFVRATCEELYRAIEPLLAELETVWSTEDKSRAEHAREIRNHRARYLPESEYFQGEIISRIASRQMDAITGFYMTEYISELDRIVRHTKKIAGLLEKA